MKSDMDKYKYTNEILKKGVHSFQKNNDQLRIKLEDKHLNYLALEERLKESEQRCLETGKQVKDFNKLKQTAINLATENGYLKTQMQLFMGQKTTPASNIWVQRRLDQGPNFYGGNGGGIC